jgi:hypothetical protein
MKLCYKNQVKQIKETKWNLTCSLSYRTLLKKPSRANEKSDEKGVEVGETKKGL